MKTKNKIALSILIVAILAATISLILLKINNKKSINPSLSVTATASQASSSTSVTSQASKTADPKATQIPAGLYVNSDYKFQVTFPESFSGYEVKKVESTGEGIVASYAVLLKTEDKDYKNVISGKAVPIKFYIFEKSFWEKSDRGSVGSSEIVKGDKYVFTYSTWESQPSDLTIITDKDLVKVIETFKLN